MSNFTKALASFSILTFRRASQFFAAAILAVCISQSPAKAEDSFGWSAYGGKQGSYRFDATKPLRRVRLIHIKYQGPANVNQWRKAFVKAADYYEQENMSATMGGDGDFFEVGGLSNSNKRIVGWFDYLSDDYGFLVLTRIADGLVYYTSNDGKRWKIGAQTSNFVRWKPGYNSYFAIQLWKHRGIDSPNAAVCFRSWYPTGEGKQVIGISSGKLVEEDTSIAVSLLVASNLPHFLSAHFQWGTPVSRHDVRRTT